MDRTCERIGKRVISKSLDDRLLVYVMLEALRNSLEITVVVTVISIVLAYPLATIIAFRVPARWQRLALLLAVLPFWTSYVVRSYSWLLVLGQNGVMNRALLGLGVIAEPLEIASTRAAWWPAQPG